MIAEARPWEEVLSITAKSTLTAAPGLRTIRRSFSDPSLESPFGQFTTSPQARPSKR